MNLRCFTSPSFKKKQIATTEGNKGHEDQRFVDFVSFCLKFPFVLGAVLLFGPAISIQAQFTYTTNNDAITITGYTGSGGDVTIPSTINGLPVSDIGTNAFSGPSISITSVTIPDSVTSIGDGAFEYSENLKNVTIPESVTNLGAGVFEYCYALTAINVASNNPAYSSLGGVLFNKSTTALLQFPGGVVGSYGIPSGVTAIESNAFAGSSVTSITIPDSVTNLGDYAFYDCHSLTNVALGNSIINIGNFAFSGPDGGTFGATFLPFGDPLTSITIPKNVITIGNSAFYNCYELTNVILGSGLVSIGAGAFSGFTFDGGYNPEGCPLSSITIPDSVTSIGDYAFYWCYSLTNVTIPESVTNIGVGVFQGCDSLPAINVAPGNPAYSSLAGALLNQSQTTLIEYPRGLRGSYTLPHTVTNVGPGAFAACHSLTTVTIPDSVKSIGDGAFESCYDLAGAYFLGNAPSADTNAFLEDSLTAYYLPGTTGWANFTTNTGVPTALWTLPYPLVLNGSSRVLSNQFGFTISWATNVPVIVEASTDLSNPIWTPIATNTLNNGVSSFADPDWTKYPNRFYRIHSR